MTRPKESSSPQRFQTGDRVRVKYGVADLDFPLGGSAGTTEMAEQVHYQITDEIERDRRTLDGMHPVYKNRCGRDRIASGRHSVQRSPYRSRCHSLPARGCVAASGVGPMTRRRSIASSSGPTSSGRGTEGDAMIRDQLTESLDRNRPGEAMALLHRSRAAFDRQAEVEADQRFARIEAALAEILRVLAEHGRILAEHMRMLEAICDKIPPGRRTMTTSQLQKKIHAVPFEPFRLDLADGRTLSVPHPDYIAHAPGTRTATVLNREGLAEVVDLSLVVGLGPDDETRGRAP